MRPSGDPWFHTWMQAGRVLDRYEVWGRLSAGGMSEVYLARHQRLAIPVVVKSLLPDLANHAALSEGLLRSARLMARVTAPQIVRILDVGEFEDEGAAGGTARNAVFLVEEYIDGVDLSELGMSRRVSLKRSLPLWAVAGWTAEAATGLHAAHQAGVLHRDVKPANLFLTADGMVKVGDFGVAVEAKQAASSVAAGTLRFIAPEMILGQPADRRADLFSLGATAFAMRYGISPFADTQSLCDPAIGPRFPPASTPYEAFFQHVLGGLLANRPDARPRTAASVSGVLAKLSRPIVPRLPILAEPNGDLRVDGCWIRFELGDIAEAEADVIVNSAYSSMTMGDGVGAALKRAGGAVVEEEALAAGEQALGACVSTTAGALKAKHVFHAVSAWNQVSCVARATHRALVLAEAGGHRRIAMPAIGTGQGRVANEACAQAIAGVLKLHLLLGGSGLESLHLVLYDEEALSAFREVFAGVFAPDQARESSMIHDALPASSEDFHAPTLHALSTDKTGPLVG